MGGGTRRHSPQWPRGRGLSPRGRGNPGLSHHVPQGRRSIPAWAGEPIPQEDGAWSIGVYPRVGGGTPTSPDKIDTDAGLSPRGRGNLCTSVSIEDHMRSIPAWAGEPAQLSSRTPFQRVYPRVGGGTGARWSWRVASTGLSPRGRGNRG